MKRTHPVATLTASVFVRVLFYTVAYLLILAFGNPPAALGLDPAWTEVLAWGLLHHAQWGRDLVFTYGPLGLLNPGSSYVSGALALYIAGFIALPAAFLLATGLLLHRAKPALFGLFALAYLICFFRLTGDISWALTLVFATTFLLRCNLSGASTTFAIAAILLAPIFAVVALIKFNMLLLWAVSVMTMAAACLASGKIRASLVVLIAFPLALLAVWIACGQQASGLLQYLSTGLEVASGYGHAMGWRAPFVVDLGGVLILALFFGACAHVAWRIRSNRPAVIAIGHAMIVCLLFWFAFLTRGDDYHWPGFFAAMSLLPFALLCDGYASGHRVASFCLFATIAICIPTSLVWLPPSDFPAQAWRRIDSNFHELIHIGEMGARREAEWRQTAESAALPKIRERVGDARVDMVTWQQGVILLNGMNYAPRPVFQSYFAYTPKLARLNEAYFLGSAAPAFVVLRLDYSDDRFPASEDGLALIALLKRYRPVLMENGFLLLARDDAVAPVDAVDPGGAGVVAASFGNDLSIDPGLRAAIGFMRIDLSPIGRIYTLLFREPVLTIAVRTGDGGEVKHRLIRLTAGSGFLITPVLQSTQDWIDLYLTKHLPAAQSIRIDTESSWERLLFASQFSVTLQAVDFLQSDRDHPPPETSRLSYPQFNVPPSAPVRIVQEDGRDVAFLHAPDSITFKPNPGSYVLSATYGIQGAALNDPNCINADPDGIGISIVVSHAGMESVLWHGEIDPFHVAKDRGPQLLGAHSIEIEAGDTLVYRVDPGHGGENVSCDWSYVRDLVLSRRGDVGWSRTHPGLIFADGFD